MILLYRILLLISLIAVGSELVAQNVSLSGKVTNSENSEPLIGAALFVEELQMGATTDVNGNFNVQVPSQDSFTMVVSYVGYETLTRRLSFSKSSNLDLSLSQGLSLAEVVVDADGFRERMRSTQMSVEQVDIKETKLLPALLGEADILKTIQLKPGIPSGSEGTTGIYVRGGGSDQNLVLLDKAVVYNANHLFGFFSTFNADAVKSLRLYKGGFPAQYGGRLSSVIDVKSRKGTKEKFSGQGGIGLIASRLTLEGPTDKQKKGSYLISGRRTYIDLITNQVNRINEDKEDFNPIPGYNFYDLNAKVNYSLSAKDELTVSGYFGRDVFRFVDDNFNFGFNWGNATGSADWVHMFSDNFSISTVVSFSDYQYTVKNEIPGFTFEVGSSIRDVALRSELLYSDKKQNTLQVGVELIDHSFEVGRLQADSDDEEISFSAGNDYDGLEFGLYANEELSIGEKIKVRGGLRLSGFSNDGITYLNLEPRLAGNFTLNRSVNLKASYARMNQYIHLVSSAGVALPTDIWYPSTARVKPQRSDQFAFGGSLAFAKQFLFSSEVYYKRLENQVDFIDGAELFVNPDLEEEFDFGRGYAYGFEVQLEKELGALTGWIGYTWQRTRRGDFPNIMQGRYFSPRFDRRHDVSVVGLYKLNKRWTLTATWVYGSGDLYWLPIGRKLEQGTAGSDVITILPVYGDRNNYRLIPFHRGDIGAVMKLFPKWGESDLTFSVFNVYDRRNAFFVYLDIESRTVDLPTGVSYEIPDRITPKQVSLFPVLPSVTWNFKF